ncbi:hypothetical protein PVAP13_5NG458400 [Panicum virgatum]|uniref:Serine aminopeptidase S33 domain-containing protein n=1 Tax=Panicum virgatum TaxID=38727 RepID=A0A8T0S245_PANVG|nr:hypothetical protein PVAP13_5NG458400 [Panicum virgatum]
MRLIQRELKYSGRAGCQERALPPRLHFSSAMDMGIHALSFLKVLLRGLLLLDMPFMLWIILVLVCHMVCMATLQALMEWWTMSLNSMKEVRELPHFLLGQSMGGAVALKIHLKQQKEWDGVLLVAPMCKISEDVTPPAPVLKALSILSCLLPEAKLFPQKDIGDLAFRDPRKRKVAEYNAISYSDQMRLRTAVELLKATNDIESQLEEISSPLLILHGGADMVTDPQVSKFLYEKASTKDKTLKLYDGSYHSILEGEPDDRISTAINDIISWLDSHC